MNPKALFRSVAVAALCLFTVMAEAQIRAAFVYVGPAGEMGWSGSHDMGRQYLEEKFGSDIKTEYAEFVPEGRAATEVIRKLAQENDIVFTTSWGYMIPTLRVAKEFPQVKFGNASGMRLRENLSNFADRAYEPRYLSGMLAGAMTKTNQIGFVAAHPIPEVIRGINAFTLGVKRVNPQAQVVVHWTRQWFAPQKSAALAQQMIREGADVLTHHTDSPAVAEVAEKQGVYVISFHSDMISVAPTRQLASVGHNWGPYYADSIQALKDGRWKSGQRWLGMDEQVAQLNRISDQVPADIRAQVSDVMQQIKQGEFAVFSGPVYNSRGTRLIREGETLSDEDLDRMNWYVDGVIGDLVSY